MPHASLLSTATMVVIGLFCATCSPDAELGQGTSASYYGNRLVCAPWGVLDNGQDGVLAHELRIAVAAYIPGELSRCATTAALQNADGSVLSQSFGFIHPRVARRSDGSVVLLFEHADFERGFSDAAARYHGLPRMITIDADTNLSMIRPITPAFEPIAHQWHQLHPQAEITQVESLGHRYLFVRVTQPYPLDNGPASESFKNVTVAGYVDCDFNRHSPGCITILPTAQLSGVQPVPLDVNWHATADGLLGFFPRIDPEFLPRLLALAPAQQSRLIMAMQGRTFADIASVEHVDQSAVGISIGSGLTHLGVVNPSGSSRPLRLGVATLIGSDFRLIANLLRSDNSLRFYHRYDTPIQLSSVDFELASLMVAEQTREEIAHALGIGRTELGRRITDLRSRVGLSADATHTYENDIALITRLADLSMAHLPQPRSAHADQPLETYGSEPGFSFQNWTGHALQNELVRLFLRTVYGSGLINVIGKPTTELRVDGQGVLQYFEYAGLRLAQNGRLSAAALHGNALRERVLTRANQLAASSASGYPQAIRLDWNSVSDPKYLQVKRWAEDFRAWVAVWQAALGFEPVPGDVMEAYGHLFYLGGPVALVHCGYNPYSPGCSCNDSGVVPLRSDNPMTLMPQAAIDLLTNPNIAYPYTLPYVVAGFSHSQHTATLYFNDSEPSRFIRRMVESLGFPNHAALLTRVFGIDFSHLTAGFYATGTKQIRLTENNVQVLQGLAQGMSAIDIAPYATDQVQDMNSQLGTNGLPSDRLLLEIHRLSSVCATPNRTRHGGLLSGRGTLEPWTAVLDTSQTPLLRIDPTRGALISSGDQAQGQATTAWSTWKAPGSTAYLALVGALEDPRFIDIGHVTLHTYQPVPLPAPLTSSLRACPLLVPSLERRRLVPIGLTDRRSRALDVDTLPYRYANTGTSMTFTSAYCVSH